MIELLWCFLGMHHFQTNVVFINHPTALSTGFGLLLHVTQREQTGFLLKGDPFMPSLWISPFWLITKWYSPLIKHYR
jgi:hypothetical protein